MFFKALAYIGGASALAALFVILATVVAVDLAFLGVIDVVALLRSLTPVLDALIRLTMMLNDALPSASRSIETSAAHVIYLN